MIRYRAVLSLVMLLGLSAAALQAGTLFLLSHFLSAESLVIPVVSTGDGWTIIAENSFVVLAILVFGALGSASLLSFLQARKILGLWRTYQVHAMNSVLSEINHACQRGALDMDAIVASPVANYLRQTQRLGMFTLLFAGSISPALRFGAFSIYAISVNPLLTIVLFLAAVPSGGLATFVFARRASRAMRGAEALRGDSGKEIERRIQMAAAGNHRSLEEFEAESSPLLRRVGLMVDRLIWVENARLTAGLITLLTLTSLILFVGYGASPDAVRWSDVLLYVLSLMLAFTQLVTLVSSISSSGKFYPAVARHKVLLEVLREALSPKHFRKRLKQENLTAGVAAGDEDEVD